jgi:hypothetical protein
VPLTEALLHLAVRIRMDLEGYVSQLPPDRAHGVEVTTGTPGTETQWLLLCDLELASGHLQVGDASFIPSTKGELFETQLPPGRYAVEVKVLDYGGDEQRISRLRVLRQGVAAPLPGECIGETWADTGSIGVCDLNLYAAACDGDLERAYAAYETVQQGMDLYGIVVLDAVSGAVMPVVSCGFGDGSFPVYGLDGEDVVGVEVEFIPADFPYPF